jgi:hypothetical protein
MPVSTVLSKNGVPTRLTEERWAHIMEEHGELAEMQSQVLDTVAEPMAVYAGNAGELLATRMLEPGKWMVVVYRETNGDGFIITAFMTRRVASLERREKRWP